MKNKSSKNNIALLIVGLLLAINAIGLFMPEAEFAQAKSNTFIKPDFCTPAINECQMRRFKAAYDGSKWDAKVVCSLNPGMSIQTIAQQMTELDLNQHGKVTIAPGAWSTINLAKQTAEIKNAPDLNGNFLKKAKMQYDPLNGLLHLDISARNMTQAPFPQLPTINGQLKIDGLPPLFGNTSTNNGPTIVTVDIIMTLR